MKIQIAQIRNKYDTNYANEKMSHKRLSASVRPKHEQKCCYYERALNPRFLRAVSKLVSPP